MLVGFLLEAAGASPWEERTFLPNWECLLLLSWLLLKKHLPSRQRFVQFISRKPQLR